MREILFTGKDIKERLLLNLARKAHISHQVCHFQGVKCYRAAAILTDHTTDDHATFDQKKIK